MKLLWWSLLWSLVECRVELRAKPKQTIDAYDLGPGFVGDRNVTDYFKLLELDRHFLLVGARNAVYNISMVDFSVKRSIIWPATEDDTKLCQMKGKSKEACHNYVRVLAREDDSSVLVCGTNAYSPACRVYKLDADGDLIEIENFKGNGLSPYDPKHNSTFFYDSGKRKLYAGTVADFGGTDALIYRKDLNQPDNLGLRTERSDSKMLNDPHFVGAFDDENHVYMWLREEAVEYSNCGKASYSRVARVCKDDHGSSVNTWTTFVKTRLNCSIPGSYPFYFDDIEAISPPVTGRYGPRGTDLVYAVFNTPFQGMRGSAVCAFSMDDVRQIFANSKFKSQKRPNEQWTPLSDQDVPKLRPGQCSEERQDVESETFMKRNPLMQDAVPNFFNDPVFGQILDDDQLTHIAVDPQVETISGAKYDVLFIATQKGKVLKVVNIVEESRVQGVLVEVVHVFSDHRPIRNLLIYRNREDSKSSFSVPLLIVVGDHEVRQLPVHHCKRVTSCSECVALQDPYCAWDISASACAWNYLGGWSESGVQNIEKGEDKKCAVDKFTAEAHLDAQPPVQQIRPIKPVEDCDCPTSTTPSVSSSQSPSFQYIYETDGYGATVREQAVVRAGYSMQHMIIAVIIALSVASVIGAMVGVLIFRKFYRGKSISGPPSRSLSPPLKALNGNVLGRSTSIDSPHSKAINGAYINAYESTPKIESCIDSPSLLRLPGDEPMSNPYSTLPKDYRVKRIYL